MDILLDTSWTLHRASLSSSTSSSYTTLFTSVTNQDDVVESFAGLSDFLTTHLASSTTPSDFDDSSSTGKLGPLRTCTSTLTSLPGPALPGTTTTTIQLSLTYTNTPQQPQLFILHTPYLLLSRAPAPHTRLITTFLSTTFNVDFHPLHLPARLLSGVLDTYTLDLAVTDGDDPDEEVLATERRTARLRTALAGLKLTITCAAEVAPHLRTMEVAVPNDTLGVLVDEVLADRGRGGAAGFSERVAGYVYKHTGLRLPGLLPRVRGGRAAEDDTGGDDDDDETAAVVAPLRLTKIVCAGFAIGADGRLKFAGRAVEGVSGNGEGAVVKANLGVLRSVVAEARRVGWKTEG